MTATYLRRGQGKSDNAYIAENCGRYPLTTAVKVISHVIRPYYKIPQRILRDWLEQLGPCEWHHVGKYATCCDYCDTEPIIDALFDNFQIWTDFNIRNEPYNSSDNEFIDDLL